MQGHLSDWFKNAILDGNARKIKSAHSVSVRIESNDGTWVRIHLVYFDKDGNELFHYDGLPLVQEGDTFTLMEPSKGIPITLSAEPGDMMPANSLWEIAINHLFPKNKSEE